MTGMRQVALPVLAIFAALTVVSCGGDGSAPESASGRHPMAFRPPQPLDPFAVQLPALARQERPDPAIAVAGMEGDLAARVLGLVL
jgi:hypothetical protein